MVTHSVIPATLDEVPIFIAFDHDHYGPLCLQATGHDVILHRLQCCLPLLPNPTVEEATQIFAPQRFGRDLAGKLGPEHDRHIGVRRVSC